MCPTPKVQSRVLSATTRPKIHWGRGQDIDCGRDDNSSQGLGGTVPEVGTRPSNLLTLAVNRKPGEEQENRVGGFDRRRTVSASVCSLWG